MHFWYFLCIYCLAMIFPNLIFILCFLYSLVYIFNDSDFQLWIAFCFKKPKKKSYTKLHFHFGYDIWQSLFQQMVFNCKFWLKWNLFELKLEWIYLQFNFLKNQKYVYSYSNIRRKLFQSWFLAKIQRNDI